MIPWFGLVILAFQSQTAEVVPGDPTIGKTVYAAHGCHTCHQINGEGIAIGPDLSRIGSRTVAYLKQSIREPNVVVAPRYRGVAVVTAAGARIRGVVTAEDSASIQLRDRNGRPHSLPKSALKEIDREADSFMPAYVMPATDVDNLVAYLKTLR